MTAPRFLSYCTTALTFAFWCALLFLVWRAHGWFDWLGIDYGFFWAAARAFLASGPVAAYDLQMLTVQIQPLAAYSGQSSDPLRAAPVPYPPLFILLFTPLTLVPPVVGFLLWTFGNLLLALSVIRGLASRWPNRPGVLIPSVLMFFPLGYTLFVGQVTIILLFGLYRAYRALEQSRDFVAGLFAGLLLLKPQYALFLMLVFVLKRRWAALQGMVLVGALIVLSNLALLGLSGLVAYYASWSYAVGFQNVHAIVLPQLMINWRGLLVNFAPGLTEFQGLALTFLLSALTASALLVIWQGAWNPEDRRFAGQFFATMLITLLASHHSHITGAALLVVPGMALAVRKGGPPLLQAILRIGLYSSPLVFLITKSTVLVSISFTALLLVALAIILVHGAFPSKVDPVGHLPCSFHSRPSGAAA